VPWNAVIYILGSTLHSIFEVLYSNDYIGDHSYGDKWDWFGQNCVSRKCIIISKCS
jgi:hypothetical protein